MPGTHTQSALSETATLSAERVVRVRSKQHKAALLSTKIMRRYVMHLFQYRKVRATKQAMTICLLASPIQSHPIYFQYGHGTSTTLRGTFQ